MMVDARYAQSLHVLAVVWTIAWGMEKDIPVKTVTIMDKNHLPDTEGELVNKDNMVVQTGKYQCLALIASLLI